MGGRVIAAVGGELMKPRFGAFLWVGFALFAGSCTAAPAATDTSAVVSTTTSTTSVSATEPVPTSEVPAGNELRLLLDNITRSILSLQPELVTDLGAGGVAGLDVGYLLEDVSLRGADALHDAALAGLAELGALDRAALTADELLSVEILEWYLEDLATMAEYRRYENPVNYITGPHAAFSEFMADVHPIASEQDAEDYVERVIAFGTQIDQLIDRLDTAATEGIVPAERSLQIARYQIGALIGSGGPEENTLVTDLKARIEAMPDEDHNWAAGIVGRATAAVDGIVIPSLEDLDDAIRGINGLSEREPGVLNLPGGDEYYAATLRHHLSLDLTPEEVHQIGLQQVDRLVAELTVELNALGYDADGDFARAMLQAAADAGSLPTTSGSERAAVLERAVETVDGAEQALSGLFNVLPEDELQVVRPRPGREGGSGAYYRAPPIDGSRPGIFYLSLGGSEFALLTMATTIYHEAIPGHHFQLSVQRSAADLPLHQRVFDFTGYAEGWALYGERLAHEAGLYDDDPLGNIGRLRMELLRATRMVVDTGIHWDGWSRDEAITYMRSLGFDNAGASAEVDRYIVWPGQAPAYMVGMLEILRLRDVAQEGLGDDFDLAGFHDVLLSHGSVPLALLEPLVEDWIAETAAGA